MAVRPYGRIGHMMHAFLYSLDPSSPDNIPIKFSHTRPNAQRMYNRAMSEPTPLGLVHLATSRWKSTKPASQHFYKHSYTTQRPRNIPNNNSASPSQTPLQSRKVPSAKPPQKNNLKTTTTPMTPLLPPHHPIPIPSTYTLLSISPSNPSMMLLR
jgi:hypothetical protein